MKQEERLMSLDAFRGFDMFWIMGGERLVCAVAALLGYPALQGGFGHVPWEGLHFMDTVFPTFLFMAGASFPFSAAKSMGRGLTRGQVALRALRRGLTLMLLGVVYWALFVKELDFATFRIPSVLGYIGFGWMVAAWIYLYVRGVWARIGVAVGILVAVTLFFGLVPAPDAATVALPEWGWAQGRGPFSPAGNFGCWLDRVILGPHALVRVGADKHALLDNEGFAGLLPTVVTAMLGMFAGEIVRHRGTCATGRKALALLGAGAVCGASGLALSTFCPIVKNLWSPSFVLVVGGCSFALFALFYWLIDVRGRSKWSFFFQVIGLNSITIYMAQQLIRFDVVSGVAFGGVAGLLPDRWGAVVLAIGYIAVCWLFLWLLYRRNVFLKV